MRERVDLGELEVCEYQVGLLINTLWSQCHTEAHIDTSVTFRFLPHNSLVCLYLLLRCQGR